MAFPYIEVPVIQDGMVQFPFYYPTDAYYSTGGKVTTINSGNIVEMIQEEYKAVVNAAPQFPGMVPMIQATRIKTIEGGGYIWINLTEKQLADVIRDAS